MPFSSHALIEHVPDRNNWVVQRDLTYYSKRLGKSVTTVVGDTTDLASVPRLVWIVIPPMDRHIVEAAMIHDKLYTLNGKLPDGTVLTRKQCDQVLSDAIRESGGKTWYRLIVYAGVRLGGWLPWNKHKQARAAK